MVIDYVAHGVNGTRCREIRLHFMAGKLDLITDWSTFAKDCGYRVADMARTVNVSTRWLEICLKEKFQKTPHQLLIEWRNNEVRSMAASGKPAKEIIGRVGLSHPSSLARAMRRDIGKSLRELRRETFSSHKGKRTG